MRHCDTRACGAVSRDGTSTGAKASMLPILHKRAQKTRQQIRCSAAGTKPCPYDFEPLLSGLLQRPRLRTRVRVWGNTLIGQAIDADTTWGGLDSRSPPARVVWGDLQSVSIAPTSMLWGNLERATWTSRNRSRIPSHHWRCEWH